MADPDQKRQLQDLDARLSALKAAQQSGKAHQEEHYSQAQVAWRMVTEMVAGLGIGFGIGYGLDILLGTMPWLMVLFTLLGLVAGIRVMLRTAAEIQAKQTSGSAGEGQSSGTPGDDEKRDRGDGD